ncbi:hypothetical protein [Clostridium sp.]|uniref:hypothetical protein n=1 Tax=Clostridium sp. TaxID=1506 RepID=UPI001A419BF7|nr:hypothetical protein [Clostridium sp.]MBK5241854.1 hypothetical protein [Clostridium sp.]
MSVKSYELKKVITSPVIIGLIATFIAFNIFIIFSSTYFNSELKILNKIVDKFGYEINDDMIANFGLYYKGKLKELNKITLEKESKTYESATVLTNNYNQYEVYNKEELEFFNEVKVIGNYYDIAKDIDIRYKGINVLDIGEAAISQYKLSGRAADTVRTQYKKLSKRFDKLKENGEYKNLFFIGRSYKMHSLLFKSLFRNFIYEIMILVVLITGYLINYEFENKTQLVVYSTKRGRNLAQDKFYVSIFASILVTTIIISITLVVYFSVVSYSELWTVPISSGFNSDYGSPYISWWNMSFIIYLIYCIVLVYLCELLFTFIAYIISSFIKNSYIVFFTFAIIFGIALVIPGLMPGNSMVIFAANFTPFVLISNPSLWFMEKGILTFKYYEVITISIWTIILLTICGLCTRRFKKQNLY